MVIESDDWGAVRMSSRAAYEHLLASGVRVDESPFCRYDALASEEDLTALFEVLSSHRGGNGKPAVLTANSVMANPDFDKIRTSGFTQYHYEPFTETLSRYPKHAGSFDLWKEGMGADVFFPQLHGREHVNVGRWLRVLAGGSPETRTAFDLGVFGIDATISSEQRGSFMAALDFDSVEEAHSEERILTEAADLFETCFGFTSQSFIAPNYIWSEHTERYLFDVGIQALQSGRIQLGPAYLGGQRAWRYTGQRSAHGQTYAVRNCIFEPSLGDDAALDTCMQQIATSFRWGKPAVVGSHRLNYIGFIDPRNRDTNLRLLGDLLTSVVRRWPNVEFMTTAQLHSDISPAHS
jgi:hypothetical protein